MNLFIERNTGVVTDALGEGNAITFDAPLASWRTFAIVFSDRDTPVEMPADTVYTLTARKAGVYDGPALLLSTNCTVVAAGSDSVYTFVILIDSLALRTAIGTQATIALDVQITWKTLGNPQEGRSFAWTLNAKNATASVSDVVPTQLPSIYRVLYVDNRFADMVAAGLFAYGNLTDAIAAANALTPPPDTSNPVLIMMGFLTDPGFTIFGSLSGIIIRGLAREFSLITTIDNDGLGSYAVTLAFEDVTIDTVDGTGSSFSLDLKDSLLNTFLARGDTGAAISGRDSIVQTMTIASDGVTPGTAFVTGNGIRLGTLDINGADKPAGTGIAGGAVTIDEGVIVYGTIRANGGTGITGGHGGSISFGRNVCFGPNVTLSAAGGIGSTTNGASGMIKKLPGLIFDLLTDYASAPPPGAAWIYQQGGALKKEDEHNVVSVLPGTGGGTAGPTLTPRSALTGSASGSLDAIVTASGSVATGDIATAVVGGVLSTWQLQVGTTAENASLGIVRPDDYNASTNARIWVQLA